LTANYSKNSDGHCGVKWTTVPVPSVTIVPLTQEIAMEFYRAIVHCEKLSKSANFYTDLYLV